MKTAKDFPLMRQFCSGSFSANSGGRMEPEHKLAAAEQSPLDVEEQWAYAEKWLREWLSFTQPDKADPYAAAFRLGQMADDAYTILWQDSDGEFTGEPSDELTKAPPYAILDEYY